MNLKPLSKVCKISSTSILLVGLSMAGSDSAAAAISDGLVSYWPMESVQGGKTPDKVSGYDMNLNNLSAADLVDGKVGKCFKFENAKQTMLSRIHGANDELPINKHAAFTVSFWANVNGTGQADLRMFSEGFTPNNNDPLFNIGTDNGGGSQAVDIFIRRSGWTVVNHIKTVSQPLDGTWRYITFVQQTDGSRKLFVDGVADELEIAPKPEGNWNLNDTTIGGILRASGSHWVTGLIDEVAVWKRALAVDEISELKANGLSGLFPPEAEGLVSHWPMEVAQGGKTPDVVSGYDMTLNNLTESDLVTGHVGKTFKFDNARQTLLSRIHGANDDLPANKHAAFTISMWANVKGTGQTDLRLFSEAFTPNNNNPLFNIGTDSGGASDSVDLYIRQAGWTDVNHIKSATAALDGAWRQITFVQQTDGARTLYVDGVADTLEIAAKPPGNWNLNDTTIGGILRASGSHWVSGLIDEVAIWKRALSVDEINKIKASGVPKVLTKKQPLELKTFIADFGTVASSDKVTLRWEGSKDANYAITPGVGDVTAATVAGSGSKDVVVANSTTYTITATRGNESITKTVTVKTQSGVAAGWHLVDTFNNLNTAVLAGQNRWLGAEGVFNVVDDAGDKWIGYDDGTELTAIQLFNLGIPEGQKGTLFFRVRAAASNPDAPITPIAVHVGLTERSIRFNGDFNANVGPYVRFERLADGATIDLQARNGVDTGIYEGIEVGAVESGKIYNLWIDVENKPFNVVDGIQTGGDVYSVHIQEDGAASRRTLFKDYVADRDAVRIDPALGAPTKDLTHVFISVPGGGQGVNTFQFDDFFIAQGSYNSSVPLAVADVVTGPTSIRISGAAMDAAGSKFSLTWESVPNVNYTVQRRSNVTGAWETIAANQKATSDKATYTDNITASSGFYRVIYQP